MHLEDFDCTYCPYHEWLVSQRSVHLGLHGQLPTINATQQTTTLSSGHRSPAIFPCTRWRWVSISNPTTVPSSMSVRVLSLSRGAVLAVLARYFKLTCGSLIPALLPDCYKASSSWFGHTFPHIPKPAHPLQHRDVVRDIWIVR